MKKRVCSVLMTVTICLTNLSYAEAIGGSIGKLLTRNAPQYVSDIIEGLKFVPGLKVILRNGGVETSIPPSEICNILSNMARSSCMTFIREEHPRDVLGMLKDEQLILEAGQHEFEVLLSSIDFLKLSKDKHKGPLGRNKDRTPFDFLISPNRTITRDVSAEELPRSISDITKREKDTGETDEN